MVFGLKKKQDQTLQPQASDAAEGETAPAPEAVLSDPSGLYKLWYLERRLQEELARAPRVNATFSLATWRLRMLPGESPPPALLEKAATLIATSLRSYDLHARIDELRIVGVLFDADYESAATVAYRLKQTMQLQAASLGKWQAGIATFPADGVDADSLIQTAFRRLEEDTRAA